MTKLQNAVTEAAGSADHLSTCAAPLVSKALQPCAEVRAAESVLLLDKLNYHSSKFYNHPSVCMQSGK